ncbi:DUF192 domain-containing protein [Streptomyces sp. NBC_00691]|uniref:DUF192 domain-containing protein n=1 Tax=Streptomyces sp. NBC_00691 TaxID=2903671 RepID=UPI002E349681|nr:DUF192 domain-containing protein [Streptomyces sp. NBC_00691]
MGKWADGTGTLATDTVREVPLEVAASYRARRRGLLGRDGVAGAMLIVRTNSVHTFGMRFAIDVAYLDRSFTVRSVVTMRPGRLGMIRPRGRHVLEAEAGAMACWGLRPGVRVRVETDSGHGSPAGDLTAGPGPAE